MLAVPSFDSVAYPTEGVLFHIASIPDGVVDGPNGVWIEKEYLEQRPILRTVTRDGIRYQFIARNPLENASETSPISIISRILARPVAGEEGLGVAAKVDLYAVVTDGVDAVREMLEMATETQPDPPGVVQLTETLVSTGYDLSCDFVNILRRSHSQYWLKHPSLGTSLLWGVVRYYSQPRDKWYAIVLADDFMGSLSKTETNENQAKGPILLGMITSTNVERLQAASVGTDYSFADEMVSAALVELGNSRIRSAIVHSVIALESASKRILKRLIESKLKGFEVGGTIEAISKDLSVVTLARLVLYQAAGETIAQGIDWPAVQELYNTRNTIIHKSRKRLPGIDSLRHQILEIAKYVNVLETSAASLLEAKGIVEEPK